MHHFSCYYKKIARDSVEKLTKTVFQEKLMKYGPLPIRVLTGIIFIADGTPKLVNIPGDRTFLFICIGISAGNGGYFALLEVIGGFALLFGVLTRIAAILFIIEMLV